MIIWIVVSVVLTLLAVLLVAPKLPPGKLSGEASGEVTDNAVLIGIGTPVFAFVVVYFVYALIAFRQRGPEPQEGVAIRGDNRVQTIWLVVTSAIVLFLAVFGTLRLAEAGAGGGEGPNPIWKPSGNRLQVQVVAQQWAFTYRYPSFGGVETPHLVLPVDQTIELHITSLDVIHSFWAPRLAVKADANPGVDNVAYLDPTQTGSFDIRCAELCGLFHGHMFDTGQVVSNSQFLAWIHNQERAFAPATRVLPPYKPHYNPAPHRRAG
jgi:cytochrome c oxidase subunit II